MKRTTIRLQIHYKVRLVELKLSKVSLNAQLPIETVSAPSRYSTCTTSRFYRRIGLLAALGACLMMTLRLYAQSQVYADYPQTRGKAEPFKLESLPSWISLDGQIRLRTEAQTSYGYVSGSDRIYELTRVYGGLTVRPTSYLTGYMQFIDTHALGLPLKFVAASMRDQFDLRQGYLEYHHNSFELYAGRRELKYGMERVVGISDFTNNSRTWDGFYGHIGDHSDKNNVDIFSTSVVSVHPTSLDTHGAGLTFHGAYGTIGSWIPKARLQPVCSSKSSAASEEPTGYLWHGDGNNLWC